MDSAGVWKFDGTIHDFLDHFVRNSVTITSVSAWAFEEICMTTAKESAGVGKEGVLDEDTDMIYTYTYDLVAARIAFDFPQSKGIVKYAHSIIITFQSVFMIPIPVS